ncbi:MAG: OmpA family protein [Phycisphaerales bacterium]|nr:OmpA family protein [Phycisphaerales bacterium]
MSSEHSKEHAPEHAEGGHGASHGGGGHGGHGGGGHAEGEHEGAPEWLISFADNVALMMGFFVILLAMNMGPKATAVQGGEPGETNSGAASSAQADRELDFVIGIRQAFNRPPSESDPRDAKLIKRLRERASKGGETNLPAPDGNDHDVQSARPSDWHKPSAVVYFELLETELSDEARSQLQLAAQQLKGTRWIIEVRGHVSASETRGHKDRAMRIGFDRALAAAGVLVSEGMTWDQLRVISCADNERATPRAGDSTGHHNNQRVEIVETLEHVASDPYNVSGNGESGH